MRSIANINKNDNIVLHIILKKSCNILKNVKASMQKTRVQYKSTIVSKYLKYATNPIVLMVTSPSVISSSRVMYNRRILRLTNDVNVQDNA